MSFTHRTVWALAAALGAGLLQPVAVRGQGPDLTGLPEQVEKLNAGQEALRKELQAMQRQLQEITSLLEARPAQPAAAPQPPLPVELVTDGAPFKGSPDAPLSTGVRS